MNREKLQAAGVDYEQGAARFMGKTELYEKFVRRFPADETFAGLLGTMENNETEAAFRYAHTLKGAVGNLSFNRLLEHLKPLVEALRSGDLEIAKALLPQVQTDYQDVVAAIQSDGQ